MCNVYVAVVPAIFKFHLDKNPRALRQRADCLGQSITAGSCLALWDSSAPGGWVGKTQQVLAAGNAAALSTYYCSPRKPWASLVWVTVVCGGKRSAVTSVQ